MTIAPRRMQERLADDVVLDDTAERDRLLVERFAASGASGCDMEHAKERAQDAAHEGRHGAEMGKEHKTEPDREQR
jgi:hypothetical protein